MVLGKGGSLRNSMVLNIRCYNNGGYEDAGMGETAQPPSPFLAPLSFKRYQKHVGEIFEDG